MSRSPRDVQRVKGQEYFGRSQGPETRTKTGKTKTNPMPAPGTTRKALCELVKMATIDS